MKDQNMNFKVWHRLGRKPKMIRNPSLFNSVEKKSKIGSTFMAASFIDTIADLQKSQKEPDQESTNIDNLIQNFLRNLTFHPKSEFEHRFLLFIKPYCRNNVILPPFLRNYYLFNSMHSTFITDLKALLLKFLELYFMEKYEQFLMEILSIRKESSVLGELGENRTVSEKSETITINPLMHLQEMSSSIEDTLKATVEAGISVIEKGVVVCIDKTINKGSLFGPICQNSLTDSRKKLKENEWMLQVGYTNDKFKQNLLVEPGNGFVFYRVIKDIKPGIRLLLAHKNCNSYVQGKESVTISSDNWSRKKVIGKYSVRSNVEVNGKFAKIRRPIVQKALELSDSKHLTSDSDKIEGFSCEQCGKMFAYEYYKAKHLKYTRCVDQGNRKFPCSQCSRSFEKRDRLRIHVLHVHEKHRPHKCTVCGKSFSQSSSLNKHLRVHSGERPYKCVYCDKAFTASSILRTHIRQHSGEKPFKCKYCWKSFASHAAHDSHVRRTHGQNEPLKKSEET